MYGYEKRESKMKRVLGTILLMIIVSITSIYLYKIYSDINVGQVRSDNENTGTAIRLSTENTLENNISTTLEDTTKCVVGISKIKNKGDSILSTNATEDLSLGTGIIVSDNGYIVTNWHLAGNKFSSCYVTLEDGNVYNGSTVWADSDLDLAIVKISASGLDYLTLGDSDKIIVGEKVYAIGNPIGVEFQRTVTSGIISGLNRTIKLEEDNSSSYMEGLIQTDASINQGNSGGPLINEIGEVIGINSVKIESAEGIGFAIPINVVKPIIERILSGEKFTVATLGIFAYDKNVIPYLNENINFENGIYVAQVKLDGAANNMLKEGDIITKIDEVELNKINDLRKYIFTKNAGDIVKLTVMRNNNEIQLEIKLSH